MATYFAFAYRNGVIGFGVQVPEEALGIFEVEDKHREWLTEKVQVLAVLAKNNETWLVPELAVMNNNEDAYKVFRVFCDEIQLFFDNRSGGLSRDEFTAEWFRISEPRAKLLQKAMDEHFAQKSEVA